MATWQYKSGLHNVGSYQVSGHPWLTGSNSLEIGGEHKIEFPCVSYPLLLLRGPFRMFCGGASPFVWAVRPVPYTFTQKNEDIISVNDIDIKNAKKNKLSDHLIDRLKLNTERIERFSLPNTKNKYIIHAHLSGLYYFLKKKIKDV